MERFITSLSIALVGLACYACDSPMEVASQASAHTADTTAATESSPASTDESTDHTTKNPAERDRYPQPHRVTLAQASTSEQSSGESDSDSSLSGQVNLNRASKETLERLPGIGPVTADRIDTYRTKRRFESADDIKRIDGVGDATYRDLEDLLTVSGETTLSE